MPERTYWGFIPTEVSLAITPGPRGTVPKAQMQVKTITGADVNIVLHGPSLSSSSHSDLNELAANLGGVTEVKCFRKPSEDGTVRCRVEIWREGGGIEIVGCSDIEGLPD